MYRVCIWKEALFLSASKTCNWNLTTREFTSYIRKEIVCSLSHGLTESGILIEDDPSVIPPLLKTFAKLGSFREGISVHAFAMKKGFHSYPSIANSAMDFYFKCGATDSAKWLFHCMGTSRDSVSWNMAIHGMLVQGHSQEGLFMFVQARHEGFEPNISTMVLILQACRKIGAVQDGTKIHGFIVRSGFWGLGPIQNSLLAFYSKSGDMVSANQLFGEIPHRDLISWSAMIGGYAQCGEGQVALILFQEMISEDLIDPDGIAIVSVLQACAKVADIDIGEQMHSYVICRGFEFDLHVGNALLDMYSKCLNIEAAGKLFRSMPETNIITWNSMLTGFVYNEKYSESLKLFSSMEKAGFKADEITAVNLLHSCKYLGSKLDCKCIHSIITRRAFHANKMVMNNLLDAYAKCNLLELAWKLFSSMEERDMITWSTMVGAFAHCSRPHEAVFLYQEMKSTDHNPNSITMVSLLEACSTLADFGILKWAHSMAIKGGIANGVAVGTAILETYAKCGEVDESRRVFDEMPEKNMVSWSAMIAAYGVNGHAHEALSMLRNMKLRGLEPNKITMISLLSACSHGGLVKEGLSCFKNMVRDHGMKPSSEHYSCLVDMLGRAGDVDGAMEVIRKMPEDCESSSSIWGALLGACRKHGNSELGNGAALRVVELEPLSSSGYLVASGMYAEEGMWEDAARMRWLAKEKQVRSITGYSSLHLNSNEYMFVSGDVSHQQNEEIYMMVGYLHSCLREKESDSSFTHTI